MRLAENPVGNVVSGAEIRVPKLSHVVADRLRAQIVSGQLQAGSRLPPETELLEVFKISRPILRESLRILESEGMIAVSRGVRTGAIVLGATIDRAAEYASVMLASGGTTLSDVHTARIFLEPSIVRALASRPDTERDQDLRECVQGIEGLLQQSDYSAAALRVNDFHEMLVRYSGNQTLILLAGILRVVLGDNFSNIVTGGRETNDKALHRNLEKTIKSYFQLVELIASGKAGDAESFWKRYMEGGLEFMERTGIGKKPIVLRQQNGAS